MPYRTIGILVGLCHLVVACASAPPDEKTAGAGIDLEAALRSEAEPIATSRYVTPDGRVRIEVPARATLLEDTDGYYGVELDVGAESAVVCFIYPDGIHLAHAVGAMTESMIGTDAGLDPTARRITEIAAGEVDGHPYVGAQWIYRGTAENGSPALGQLTVYSASKEEVGVACLQNEVGFEATFRRVFEATLASLELEGSGGWSPYYVEVATLGVGGHDVGVMRVELSLDSEGDTRIATTTATVMPASPNELSTSDDYQVEYSTEAGQLINTWSQSIEAGALKTELALGRRSEDSWAVSGTFEQKDLEAIIDAGDLTSTLGQMRELRNAIRRHGAGSHVAFPVWVADADPTRLIESSVEVGKRLADDAFEVVMTVGPLSISGVVDDSGSLKTGEMHVGPVELSVKRVYQSGEF